MSTTPSCLSFPFPWFGGREKGGSGGQQQQEEERFRERLRSVSSSSLPYLTTSGRGEQVRGAQSRAWWGCSHQLLALKSSRIVYFEFPLGINKV